MTIFKKYAYFYDLLYKEKNYQMETDYIANIIQFYKPGAKTILDLGCGTGRHAELLAEKGYQVHGVDSSIEMIKKANSKVKNSKASFSIGDIRNINLNTKFDVVISLFHVISYQTTNEDLKSALNTAYDHLCADGLFIFDFWYGPAVLNLKPEIRVKRYGNETIEITRIAEPTSIPNENTVIVNYHIYLREKRTGKIEAIAETHKMRYLFKPEIELYFSNIGFKLEKFNVSFSDDNPSEDSWNVIIVAVKNE